LLIVNQRNIFLGRRKMQFARSATIVVAIHAIVVVLHGLAHQKVPVPLSWLQSLFVGVVIVLAPVVAVGLLRTRFEAVGRWLFLGSMTGALLFGIYYHFIAMSPDRISQVPFAGWGATFQVTAILLLLTEALGSGVGLWASNPMRAKAVQSQI
jgi:hypothetical protein